MKRLSLVLALLATPAIADQHFVGFGMMLFGTVCGQPVIIVAQDEVGRTLTYKVAFLYQLPPEHKVWVNKLLDSLPEDRYANLPLDDGLTAMGIRVACPKPFVTT